MIKTGRMAADDQRQVVGNSAPPPEPPPELLPAEMAIWRRVVSDMPSDWFTSENQPLLKEFCRHSAFADALALDIAAVRTACDEIRAGSYDVATRMKDLAKTSAALQALLRAHHQQTQSMGNLATKLRMTQQARYVADRAQAQSRGRPPAGAKPWEVEPAAALTDAGLRYSIDSDTRQ